MQNNFRTMFIVICALVLPSMTFAKVEVSSIFGDNMMSAWKDFSFEMAKKKKQTPPDKKPEKS